MRYEDELRMTRRTRRILASVGHPKRSAVDDDEMRFTTHDFVRRGIYDPEGGPMGRVLSLTEGRSRAMAKVQSQEAAAKRMVETPDEERRARSSDGVRPYLDFHSGQRNARWVAQVRGEAKMAPTDAYQDRMIAAQRELLLNPCAETVEAEAVARQRYVESIGLAGPSAVGDEAGEPQGPKSVPTPPLRPESAPFFSMPKAVTRDASLD